MEIIRFAKIEDTVILTPSGELLSSNEKLDFSDLFEEETKKAFNKGFEKGCEAGYEKVFQEAKTLLNLLQTIVRKTLEQKERLLDQLKPEIIEFALKVCERIIRKELSQKETLVKLIDSLLTATAAHIKGENFTIFLSSEDFMLLESHKSQIQTNFTHIEGVHLVEDPLMRPGDVRIENKTGLLNYEISRELSDLQSKVLSL